MNSTNRYGIVTKFFHWAIFLFFLNQYVVARIMLNTGSNELSWGFTQGALYNWHKSIGLIALAVIFFRYVWRRTTRLPDWATGLTPFEKQLIHWIERILYLCMFLMPLSGYLFVMSGGYGVHFFSRWHLPNPLPQTEGLALAGQLIHRYTSWAILIVLALHIGLGLKHQLFDRDRYLNRMLPFTRQ